MCNVNKLLQQTDDYGNHCPPFFHHRPVYSNMSSIKSSSSRSPTVKRSRLTHPPTPGVWMMPRRGEENTFTSQAKMRNPTYTKCQIKGPPTHFFGKVFLFYLKLWRCFCEEKSNLEESAAGFRATNNNTHTTINHVIVQWASINADPKKVTKNPGLLPFKKVYIRFCWFCLISVSLSRRRLEFAKVYPSCKISGACGFQTEERERKSYYREK